MGYNKNLTLTNLFDKSFYVYGGNWHCVSNHIRQYGYWDLDQIKLIQSFSDENKIFIDVGSQIGSYSIPLSDNFNKVISFEPNIESYELLKKNIEVSKTNNVIVMNKAVSDTISSGNMTGEYGSNLSEGEGETEIITLDSEILKLGFSYGEIGFIKIDIEGHELKALNGSMELITTANPIIYLETHGDEVKHECLNLLFGLGYTIKQNYNDIDFLLIKNT
jgi:FkbM family methyltransferase